MRRPAYQPCKMQGCSGGVEETWIYLPDARLHKLNERLTESPLGLSVEKIKQKQKQNSVASRSPGPANPASCKGVLGVEIDSDLLARSKAGQVKTSD